MVQLINVVLHLYNKIIINKNIDLYIAHASEIQIIAFYNTNMDKKYKIIIFIYLILVYNLLKS